MIIYKPDTRHTEHLREKSPTDHRDVLDLVWQYRHASPDTSAVIEGMSQWHKWGALDQHEFYKMMAGTFAGQEIRMVACMTPQGAALMHHLYPDILKDKNEFYRVLREHPEWCVPKGAA